eukprot:g20443.t1
MSTEVCGDFRRGKCYRSHCRYQHIMPDGSMPSQTGSQAGYTGYFPSPMIESCKDWERGECTRGRGCRYSHDIPAGTSSSRGNFAPPGYDFRYSHQAAPPHQPPSQQMYPGYGQQYGGFPSVGAGHYGSPAPGFGPPIYTQQPPPLGGGDPNYAAMLQSMKAMGSPYTSAKETCGDFRRGMCMRGASCKYLHPASEEGTHGPHGMRVGGTIEMCGDFLRGICSRGDSCRYTHDKSKTAPCRDYERGLCTRGDSCRYYHNPALAQQPVDGTAVSATEGPFHPPDATPSATPGAGGTLQPGLCESDETASSRKRTRSPEEENAAKPSAAPYSMPAAAASAASKAALATQDAPAASTAAAASAAAAPDEDRPSKIVRTDI